MDMNPKDSSNNKGPGTPGEKKPKWLLAVIVALGAVLLMFMVNNMVTAGKYTQKTFSEFLDAKNAGQLAEVQLRSDRIVYLTKEEAAKEAAQQKACYTGLPTGANTMELLEELHAAGVTGDKLIVEDRSGVISILYPIFMFLMIFAFMSFLTKRMSGDGALGGMGKSKAKVYMEKQTGVTFKDVAGQDEAKESLQEIIDFLHTPEKYAEIGAKLPKGALLVGPPGTGKTLLAKAVAGEADVPFFSVSGSDFEDTFVGVGSSRVRDLFKEAAKVAPCIIFIDEIDAVGHKRNERLGHNDQTLNSLLGEIDGFEPTKGIVCLAATNRPEILDKALLRPGRFDRRIIVDRPNSQGRLDTLKVHTQRIKMSEDVDLKKLAQATAGAV